MADGVDRVRQPQRFEQQDTSVDFASSAYNASATTLQNRGPFLGSGVINDDFSSRSMRADPLPNSHTEVAAVAAAGPGAAAAAAEALAVEEDDARHRWGAEVQAGRIAHLQREAASPVGNSGGNGDGGHEEEEEEEEDTRDGEATDENEADSSNARSSVVAPAATAETTALLLPPQLRQPSHSPLSSPPPPPPPDASLAFATVAATGSSVGRVAGMEEARPEDHHEELTRTVGALPTIAGGGATAVTPATNSENVLQRMAEACRQAGVILVSLRVTVRRPLFCAHLLCHR